MRNMLVLLVMFLSFTSCSVYQPDLIQGKTIDDKTFSLLKYGMSRDKVVDIIGSPALAPSVSNDRWHYIYSFSSGSSRDKEPEFTKVVLVFANNELIGYRGNLKLNIPRL